MELSKLTRISAPGAVVGFCLAAVLMVHTASLQAATLYKWVDEDGNVTYQDTPPPGDVSFESDEIDRPPEPLEDGTSADIEAAALNNPVTLYTVPNCDSCDLIRLYLERNSIPYLEKDVRNDVALQIELEQLAGTISVPTLTVGNQLVEGYSRTAIADVLNGAGFPVAEGSTTRTIGEDSDATGQGDDAGNRLEPLDLNNDATTVSDSTGS